MEIERLNSLEVQLFQEAEPALQGVSETLGGLESRMGEIGKRLESVRQAQAAAPQALSAATRAVAEAARFQGDKLSGGTAQRLEEARRRLLQGQELAEAGGFLAALAALNQAREMALAAQRNALAEVREVDRLQAQVDGAAHRCRRLVNDSLLAIAALPPRQQSGNLAYRGSQLRQALTAAEKARLAVASAPNREQRVEALNKALAAFQGLERLAEDTRRQVAAMERQTRQRSALFPSVPAPRQSPRQPGSPSTPSRPSATSKRPSRASRPSGRAPSIGSSSRGSSLGSSRRSPSTGSSHRSGSMGGSRRR